MVHHLRQVVRSGEGGALMQLIVLKEPMPCPHCKCKNYVWFSPYPGGYKCGTCNEFQEVEHEPAVAECFSAAS